MEDFFEENEFTIGVIVGIIIAGFIFTIEYFFY